MFDSPRTAKPAKPATVPPRPPVAFGIDLAPVVDRGVDRVADVILPGLVKAVIVGLATGLVLATMLATVTAVIAITVIGAFTQ